MTAGGAKSTASQLAVRRFGKGARRVLGLHCTLAHSGAWRGLAEAMQDEITLDAPDMLCHGKSPDWDGSGNFTERMVAEVLPLLEQPVDLIGHSMGGVIALHIAAWHPKLVRSLTLVEPVFFGVVAQDAPDLLAEQKARSAPFDTAISAGEFDAAARLFNGGWGSDGRGWEDTPAPLRAAMARGVRIVPACAPTVTDDLFGLLNPGGLARVTMPVMLLRGDRTQPIIAAANHGLAQRLPQSHSVVVAEAGHMLPLSHPEDLARNLRGFITLEPNRI